MSTTKKKRMRTRKKCEACGGCGYIEFDVGLAALQERYPDLPMREMQDRGWLGFPDENDVAACDAAFLTFFEVASHEEYARKRTERREFPWNARTNSPPFSAPPRETPP